MHKKSVVAALIGHILERYDVALYGYFSTLLTPVFFPYFGVGGSVSIMASFGAFAAGYFMRPLGGILFGHLGDRYGRKKSFTLSICLVVIPTFTIGVLPSYQSIGVLAPIILILCRLIQGLCNGGEFGGAGIFVGEHVPARRSGLGGSLVCACGIFGAVVGTTFGMIVTLPGIPSWGWRIPFILGSVMTLIAWRIRRTMIDPPSFQKILDENSVRRYPLLQVLKNHKTNMLCALTIGGFGHALLYTATIYMNVVYTVNLKLNSFMVMFINTMILLWWVFLSPLVGLLADRFKIINVMLAASVAAVSFSCPLFWYLNQEISLYRVFIFQLIFSSIGVCFVAPISSLFTSFFPIKERYSGVAFSVTLGQALLGGTTPLIATFLAKILNDPIAPAYFVILCGFFAIIALARTNKYLELSIP